MKFKINNLKIYTGSPMIAVMHKRDAALLDVYTLDRIKITRGNKTVVATLDITESEGIAKPGEIGLFSETSKRLSAKSGSIVNVKLEEKPKSIGYIKKKLNAKRLSEKEIYAIIKDIADEILNEIEVAYFVSACYIHKLSIKETVALTKAMIATGDVLNIKRTDVVDKHCIGGVAGNRTTPIIVAILAAGGLIVPNTSSRAITSAAGTADTMEVLCNVNLSLRKMKEVSMRVGGCLAWGGALELAPSDDEIIRVEHPLSLDPTGQLIASILAKKGSVSAKHVLIDIPVGKGAKIEKMKGAKRLKKLFMKVAKAIGLKVKVYVTDGSQPIGNGIGPVLEAREILWLLHDGTNKRYADKYHDLLRRKCLHIAGDLFELSGKTKKGEGYSYAKKILESGMAFKKFRQIIGAQGGKIRKPERMRIGRYQFVYAAPKRGKVVHIDNKIVNRLARIAGAPHDKEAGLYLHVHKKYMVKKGQKIFTLYSDNKERLKFAEKEFKIKNGIIIK